jgi:UDP-N-acetylglucosamine 2-epimerase (non-hydrolysing)
VEAGLRTGDKYAPFPEEMNRRVTGTIADLHFAPTKASRENLLREGVPEGAIVVTGNTVIDALLSVAERLRGDGALAKRMEAEFPFLDPSKKLILVTGHRREAQEGSRTSAGRSPRSLRCAHPRRSCTPFT